MRDDLWTTLERTGTLPVVILDEAYAAVPVAQALRAGGLPIIEITLRTPAALDAIRAVAETVPDMHLGAGTVLNATQVDEAADAGATFIVSPGLSEEVVQRAVERGLTAIPGVSTATDIQQALALGCSRVKLFPAAMSGGPDAVKAFASPFPDVTFVPTGGISQDSAGHYLELPNVLAVGGSWVVDRAAVAAGDFTHIEAAARAAVSGSGSIGKEA